mgnify:CR=1 FL=1
MKIVIDIGNTSITAGLFERKKLIKKIHFKLKNDFDNFLDSLDSYEVKASIISSVVPQKTNEYIKIIKERYNLESFLINYQYCPLDLDVPDPKTIGADRLCNITAASIDYNCPAIVVDFGTSTTFDVINSKKQFIGGVIAPGVETSAQYLIDKAALLNSAPLKFPKNVIGKVTKTNIQSGIMYGAVDQVEGMIQRIILETNERYQILLTGGFSILISEKLKIDHIVDIDLTLKGMIHLYEHQH